MLRARPSFTGVNETGVMRSPGNHQIGSVRALRAAYEAGFVGVVGAKIDLSPVNRGIGLPAFVWEDARKHRKCFYRRAFPSDRRARSAPDYATGLVRRRRSSRATAPVSSDRQEAIARNVKWYYKAEIFQQGRDDAGMVAKRASRTTLKDIARLAGVSVTTASVALSGKGEQERISAEVVRRVKEIALQRDYAPNLLVRSLQSGRTHVLTFYSSFRTHPRNDTYYSRLITALEQAAGEQGYNLLIYCRSQDSPDEVYENLNGGWCDGVVFFGPPQDDLLLARLQQSRVPTVILNHDDPAGILSSVVDDWADGIRQVADTLVQLGHIRIGAVTAAPEERNDGAQRVAALRSYLAERGIIVDDADVIPMIRYDKEHAKAIVSAFQKRPDPPTAIFCWHDLAGYYILDACKEMQVSVPEEFSVIGYDGIHWATHSGRRLASVYVDLEEQAVEAIRILNQLICGTIHPPVRKLCPAKLRAEETLAPPRSS